MTFDIHPIAAVFPELSDADYRDLLEDIRANGQHEPIIIHDGKIVDGRTRYKACRELGIEPKVTEWDGQGSLASLVMSLNSKRRHLTQSQKAAIAVDIEPFFAAEAKARQRESGKEVHKGKPKVVATLPQASPDKSREQAAKQTGASGRNVSNAKKVKAKSPMLHEQVRQGKLTVAQAVRQVDRQERSAALDAKAKAVAEKPATEKTWKLIDGNCVIELSKIEPGSVRLIFADPPYNIGVDYGDGKQADSRSADDYLAFCRNWMKGCANALAADGSLWVLINDEWADHFGIILRGVGLHRRAWIKWYETFGVNQARNFNRTSRHLFYMVKDAKRFVFNEGAVNRKSDRQTRYGDKRADAGGKVWDDVWIIPRLVGTSKDRIEGFPTQLPIELLQAIVGCASDPGDTVLDPFNGSGTTGAASIELGRSYVGIDTSKKYIAAAEQRLSVVVRGVPELHGEMV